MEHLLSRMGIVICKFSKVLCRYRVCGKDPQNHLCKLILCSKQGYLQFSQMDIGLAEKKITAAINTPDLHNMLIRLPRCGVLEYGNPKRAFLADLEDCDELLKWCVWYSLNAILAARRNTRSASNVSPYIAVFLWS